MPDEQNNNSDPSSDQAQTYVPASTAKKSSRALLVLFLIFSAFVTVVLLTQREDKIHWIEDYQTGLELARQQKKPVLLAFYKQFSPFYNNMRQHTYKDLKVIEYIQANFVPVLIDVDKQPTIAQRYKVGYYPTHYIEYPDSDQPVGFHIGYDVPSEFVRKIEDLRQKLDSPSK